MCERKQKKKRKKNRTITKKQKKNLLKAPIKKIKIQFEKI